MATFTRPGRSSTEWTLVYSLLNNQPRELYDALLLGTIEPRTGEWLGTTLRAHGMTNLQQAERIIRAMCNDEPTVVEEAMQHFRVRT